MNELRAAIYNRASTDRQAERGYNLKGDEERARDRIDRERWHYVGSYIDGGEKGDDPNRPEYRRLLTDVAAGAIDVIVIPALDRFGRDSIEIKTKLALFDQQGVTVVSLKETIDRETPEGRLQTGILAEFAEFEKAKIRARTKQGIGNRAVLENKPWGEPKYGFQKGDDGHWIQHPQEAKVVERIFYLRIEAGLSYSATARKLIADGVLPRRKGSNWTPTTVKRIIEGREVRGYFKHKGHWIKGKHAPIIDEDTWLAAQVMKEKGSKYAPSRPGRRPARHLFAGVTLRCGYCGEAMLPRSNPDRYCCRTNKQIRGAGTCPMPVLTREQVDTYFLSVFECNFLDYEGTRQQIAEQLDRDVSNTAEALREADLAVARLEAQLTRVEADYLAEELGAAAYTRMSAKLEADRDAALAERNRLEDRTVELQRVRSNIDAESETLRRLDALRASIAASSKDAEANGDIETLRGVLAAAFARIYINDKGHAMSLECGSRWEGPRPIPTEPDRIMVTGEQTSYAIPFTNAVVQAMVIAGDR